MNTNEPLTELERTKLENYALKHNLVQQQLQQIVAERTAYIQQIVAAHPGCTWDEQKGLLRDEPAALPNGPEHVDAAHTN